MKPLRALCVLIALGAGVPALARPSTDNSVNISLRLVNVTGTPDTSLVRAAAANTAPDVSGSDRTRRFEVQYTLGPSIMAIFPAGLVSGQLAINGGAGAYAKAPLSRLQVQTGGLNAADVDLGATDTSGPPTGPSAGATGMHRPYRGGFSVVGNNNNPANGTIGPAGISIITPLVLSQSLTSGNPFGWYAIYSFTVTIPDGFSGSFPVSADFDADPSTGARFGFFDDGIASPLTSNNSTAATVNIAATAVAVAAGKCCLPGGGCSVISSAACAMMGGSAGPTGSDCSLPYCCTTPAFASVPQAQAKNVNESASFSASVTGTGPFTYQWFLDGSPLANGARITGAQSAMLSISGLVTSDAGDYTVQAASQCGVTLTSAAATLTVRQCPMVTDSPVSRAVCAGNGFTLHVGATGTPAPTYQWRKDTLVIPGAISSTLGVISAVAGDAGSYDCVVTNACGMATSAAAAVEVINAAPTITIQPLPLVACEGAAAAFTTRAPVLGTKTFQWRKNSANIPGANTNTLTFSSVTLADAGSYDCVITNTCGTATTQPASLTVNAVPAITLQPIPASVCTGQRASFIVRATGGAAKTFQWRKNTVPVAGATTNTLTIPAAAVTDAGSYDCLITNTCAATPSDAVALSVTGAAPVITRQPLSAAICAGSPVSFIVRAPAGGLKTFQWRKNTVPITGAAAATLALAAPAPADAGNYDCVITNACGTVTSLAAVLTVSPGAATITLQPVPLSLCAGSPATLTIRATGGLVKTFQWRKDGAAIPGATANSLAFAALSPTDTGSYDCVVTNACGSVPSSPAAISVSSAVPTISKQPDPVSVCEGGRAVFTVRALGGGTRTFQWRRNTVPILNANTNTLTIDPVLTGDVGRYDCVVTNACGTGRSVKAALTVLTCPAGLLACNQLPVITAEPESLTARTGTTARLSVMVADSPGYPASVEWFKDGKPLRDSGSRLTGATSALLNIAAVERADVGTYLAVVSNACGAISSVPVTISLCSADVDGSGTVTLQDLFAYLDLYLVGDRNADRDGSGTVAAADLFDFLSAWFARCE